ncbi:glycosyltransferase family 2 protein [Motilibacter aurantiacus]|uniref:glycosyltransferase family 2 protein n=1 Tax=Motilibacter aurantiacus TaxID=2714955 RepID=UPI00140777A2|nr:glycosyltransferase [Motilibacter aurantiacus]
MRGGTPRATVVVCCYNGADTLPHVLQALAAQTVRNEIEVLVVDDGSADDTAAVAAAAGVRVVRHARNRGLAAARNTGWRAAAAPVVAYTDDDCRPRPDWVERLLGALDADPLLVACGGAVRGSRTDTFVLRYLRENNPLGPLEASLLEGGDGLARRLGLYLQRSAFPERRSGRRPVSSVVGASMAFRVELLERLGGFDERFRFGGEEEDFCRRQVLGGEVPPLFVPDALVEHDFEPGLADTLRRSRAYGRGNARMYFKHEGLSPTAYPLPVAVLAGVTAAALLRRPALAVGALALPQALFATWPVRAVRERRPELLLYPYVQALQEAASDAGLASGLLSERARFAAPRRGAAAGAARPAAERSAA